MPVPRRDRRMPATRIILTGLLLTLLGLSACRSLDTDVAERQAAVAERWRALASQPARAITLLDWPDAVQRMEAGNLKLIKARESVRATEERLRQVPRNLIPELNLNFFANPNYDNLAAGGLGATYFFIGGLINLPNPLQYHYQAAQAELACLQARVNAEILRRDLQAKLYRLFRQASRLDAGDARRLALQRLDDATHDHPFAQQIASLDATSRQHWLSLESDLADLLGDYSRRWRPRGDSPLPVMDYAAHPPALDGDHHFGALQITQAALQLVVLDAQKAGLLIGEWPQVSVLLSAPPIYQRSAGRDSYLSLDDLRLSLFAAYTTDLRGSRSLNRRQAARQREITRHELDVAMQATMVRLRNALELGRDLRDKRLRLLDAAGLLRAAGDLTSAYALQQQADDIQEQLDDLNLSFWVLDDPRWSHPS